MSVTIFRQLHTSGNNLLKKPAQTTEVLTILCKTFLEIFIVKTFIWLVVLGENQQGVFKIAHSIRIMLFLELGLVPFREMIRQRRLGFLFYILNQSKESLIYKVFECQRRNSTPKDWVTTILSDLNELNWDITIEDIQQMKKKRFLNIVKRKVQ